MRILGQPETFAFVIERRLMELDSYEFTQKTYDPMMLDR